MDSPTLMDAVRTLAGELFDGSSARSSYILNSGEPGLLEIFRRLTPEQASTTAIPGRATIAAHANHLRFSLNLLNRAARGENAYAGADWPSSWQLQQVDALAWDRLREELSSEWERMRTVEFELPAGDQRALTGVISTPAHIAYHFGAVRQLLGALGLP